MLTFTNTHSIIFLFHIQLITVHPIEIQSLGHTTCTEQEFEAWCRAQSTRGGFSPTDYDLLTRNCNNFSEVAAKQGLRLQRGVPQWILELPQKFMSSPSK